VDLKTGASLPSRVYENYKPWIKKISTAFGKFNTNGKPQIGLQSNFRQGLLHVASPPEILFCRHFA
jgi:hypothetical protein